MRKLKQNLLQLDPVFNRSLFLSVPLHSGTHAAKTVRMTENLIEDWEQLKEMNLVFGISVILYIHQRKNWNQLCSISNLNELFQRLQVADRWNWTKKNCGIGSISTDDALWKLLDIRTEEIHSTQPSASKVNFAKTDDLPQDLDTPAEAEHGSLFSPVKVGSFTLFGRAWLGIQNSPAMPGLHNLSALRNITSVAAGLSKVGDEEGSSTGGCNEKFNDGSIASKGKHERAPFNGGTKTSKEKLHAPSSDPGEETRSDGTSRILDFSLRKLYRSMNVAVPRPLPSLSDLMHVAKRAKVSAGKR